MISINNRFVLLPNYLNLSELGLRYTDLLIYVSLRSFHNQAKDLCYPTYESIAARAGVQKNCAIQAVQRLLKSGLVTVKTSTKKRVSNRYEFKACDAFLQIPYDIFAASDLTFNQKAMLLLLRKCFDSSSLICYSHSYADMAEFIGVSYKTLYTQYKPIVDKGYILEVDKHRTTGSKSIDRSLTDKINWRYTEPPKPKVKKFESFPLAWTGNVIMSVPTDDVNCTSVSARHKPDALLVS